MELAIQTRGITKRFADKVAVNGIDLDVEAGQVFAVLGPNGAGKTTLLRMLATQCRMDGGSASVFGVDVATRPMAVRRMIGMTGQFATIDADLTAIENLEIAGRLRGMGKAAAIARADELLGQFSLSEARDLELSAFSGGMRRRLDLAASLMVRPRLIILDEPTTGLDPITRQELWDVIRGLVAQGSTVLLTTQYLEEADQLADNIAVIQNGALVAQGTPDQLKALVGEARLEVAFRCERDAQLAARAVEGQFGRATTPLEGRMGFSVGAGDAALSLALLNAIETGVFDRFKSLPIAPLSPLTGMLTADIVRYAVAAACAIVVGYLIGWRPAAGVGWVVAATLLVIFVMWCISWVFAFIGVMVKSSGTISAISTLLTMVLGFVSNAIVDIDSLPGALAVVAGHNPITYLVDAYRAMVEGGVFGMEAACALVASCAVLAVFIPATFVAYKRRL